MNLNAIAAAFLVLFVCSSCKAPTSITTSSSFEPDPMTDAEYEQLVEDRTEKLIKKGLTRHAAEKKAEQEADKQRWHSTFMPVRTTSITYHWE